MEQLKTYMKTILYDRHVALGAKIVNFHGWEMPIQYQGIIQEHMAVRQKAGIFDVSHMGYILISGAEAEGFLDFVCTNQIAGKAINTATYTVLASPCGGCIDDVIVFKHSDHDFSIIVNAGNRLKDLDHLRHQGKRFAVNIEDCYQTYGILAIQGVHARTIAAKLFPDSIALQPMHCGFVKFNEHTYLISTTGYTGAGGVEISGPNDSLVLLWDTLLQLGKEEGLVSVGLGARDTLRLEKAFALYGNELNDNISPLETVSAWTVKMEKDNFLGKEAMEKIQKSPDKRSQHGIVLLDKGIARSGHLVFQHNKQIGVITSGTHSPILSKAIAIAFVNTPLLVGDIIEIQIRDHLCKAQVVPIPFIP